MKIRGALVDILVEMNPEKYQNYVTYEKRGKIIYVVMSKALYRMLESAILYYKKFRRDIEQIGYTSTLAEPGVVEDLIKNRSNT